MSGDGVGEEAPDFAGEDVDGVVAFVALRGVFVALVGRVEVGIGVRVKEEVGARPAGGEGVVVVFCCVRVEELAYVVGLVAGRLEPYG